MKTKLNDLGASLAMHMDSTCICEYPSEIKFYFNDSICLPDNPQAIVVWGRVFGTDTCKSADIINCLQAQVEAESQHSVEGVHLKAMKYCSVDLDEETMPFCEEPTDPPTDSPTDGEPFPIYIVIGVAALLLALVIVVLACIVTMRVARKKQHKQLK